MRSLGNYVHFLQVWGSQPQILSISVFLPQHVLQFCDLKVVCCPPFNMVHGYPKSISWNMLHCSCSWACIKNPFIWTQSGNILAGTRQIRLLRSQRRSLVLCCPKLIALCLKRIFLSAGGKISLVCGSDGMAAQMGLLVRITGVSAALAGKEWERSVVSHSSHGLVIMTVRSD